MDIKYNLRLDRFSEEDLYKLFKDLVITRFEYLDEFNRRAEVKQLLEEAYK